MRIFVIAGKAGSGKNEVSRLIKEYYIYKLEDCAVTSYGKYIYNFVRELTDWDGMPGNKPRDFMQKIGDVIRDVHPNYFTSNMIQDIAIYEKYVNNLVISDARMPGELDKIRDCFENVYTIYVENQFGASKLTIDQQSHITEHALEGYNDFDYVIANDTMENLKDKVFKILEEIK